MHAYIHMCHHWLSEPKLRATTQTTGCAGQTHGVLGKHSQRLLLLASKALAAGPDRPMCDLLELHGEAAVLQGRPVEVAIGQHASWLDSSCVQGHVSAPLPAAGGVGMP